MTRILIADDDEFLSKMYTLSLQEQGYDVTVANDGKTAAQKLDASLPDLLILDILMPGMTGYDVMQHIKKNGYKLPVIVLTNVNAEKGQQLCTEMGASGFFNKSTMDLEELVQLVKKFV